MTLQSQPRTKNETCNRAAERGDGADKVFESLPRYARPPLKWAGGKTQLLPEIVAKIPKKYGSYIEPFFGGGALFFALKPQRAVIADSNPELISLYQTLASDVYGVIEQLGHFRHNEECFYRVRSQDWTKLAPAEAAARTIFLNRTCFNGLYRVNRRGQFNVPFGRYKNPKILDQRPWKRRPTFCAHA